MHPRTVGLLLLSAIALPASADLAKGLDAAAAQQWREALKEFRPLAEKGDANAEVNLGNLYMRGLGVEQDYARAYHWYDKAARQGNVAGQAKLGLMHYYGLGVMEDHAAAAEWFLKAAEQGDPEAALVLGELYSKGDGVARQATEAYLWYAVAADLGKQDAQNRRIELLEEMSPADINIALTRLKVWREHHDSTRPRASRVQPELATNPETGKQRRSVKPPANRTKKPPDSGRNNRPEQLGHAPK